MDNRVKSLQTRSGHRLVFTEDESILLTDKSGNELRFDTEGSNINITAPETIFIKSKNLKFDIEESIETKAGKNMDTNVGQNIKIIAKEEISQDSGKKTIINAGTNTEISAKAHLDLYGKEKFIGYTDGQKMNKLPQNGEFFYDKEKKIINLSWVDENREVIEFFNTEKDAEKIYVLAQTRFYEEGEQIDINVFENNGISIKDGNHKFSLSGKVEKDGFALLNVEIDKDEELENDPWEGLEKVKDVETEQTN